MLSLSASMPAHLIRRQPGIDGEVGHAQLEHGHDGDDEGVGPLQLMPDRSAGLRIWQRAPDPARDPAGPVREVRVAEDALAADERRPLRVPASVAR